MADQDPAFTSVHISARDVPPPSTISPAAQKFLSDGAAAPLVAWPDPADKQAWRDQVAATDKMLAEMAPPVFARSAATHETKQIAGVTCYDCAPTAGAAADGPVYLFVHGGAFVIGGGVFAAMFGVRYAAAFQMRVVSVDYRMPPDHPFPAALDDCVAVYRALIETVDPARVVIGGSSAGGNIAAATILRIRDEGLPLPAAAVLLTPEVDLTESGDSFRTNADLDVILKRGLPECNALYADGHDLRDPYLSPLFADFTKGFPPSMIQTGTRDLFLSNSAMLHRKLRAAGIEAELHVWEAMPHSAFGRGDAPEHDEITAEVGHFIRKILARGQ